MRTRRGDRYLDLCELVGSQALAGDGALDPVRLRWRYMPGSDLFFVYREILDLEDGVDSDRTVAFKMNYRFDLVF